MKSNQLQLTLALGPYEHTRDLVEGQVQATGIDFIALDLPIEEIFYRFTRFREWDVSELSLGKYVSMRSQGDDSLTAIPVFVSRAFRHSSVYVKNDSPIRALPELKGKRMGIPEWAQTASIFSRAMLAHEEGVPLSSVEWVQAGVNEPGRVEKVALKLPADIRYRNEPRRSLNDMLLAGDLDAVLSARPPSALGSGIRRLIEDYRPLEEAYFRKTSVYPIMHAVVIKTDILRQHPWVAMNLFGAFNEAKRRSVERLADITASLAPLPWLFEAFERARDLFGDDPFPYGIDANTPGGVINRRTLEAFLLYAFEQGVCHRHLALEELFPREVLSTYKV